MIFQKLITLKTTIHRTTGKKFEIFVGIIWKVVITISLVWGCRFQDALIIIINQEHANHDENSILALFSSYYIN